MLALPPDKCYVTDLQVRAWAEWLAMDMNRAGKAERYAAQTACEVRRSWVKTPAVSPDDFLMQFVPNPAVGDGADGTDGGEDDRASLEAEKRAVMGAFGGKGKYTPPPPKEPDPPDEDQWVDDPWGNVSRNHVGGDG